MSKRQYLESLREYLSFELPERLVKKNLDFYEDYFSQQMRSGKTADQICEELGDAQLIARSCIEAEKAGVDGIPESQDDNSFEKEMYGNGASSSQSTWSDSYRRYHSEETAETTDQTYGEDEGKRPKLLTGAGCLLSALILMGLVCLVVAFFSSSFGSILLSIVILFALFNGIMKLFRR